MKNILMMVASAVALTTAATGSNALAADVCQSPELAAQPILAEGRVVPLSTYTHKIRKNLFAKGACDSISATQMYCLLSLGRRAELEQNHGCRLGLKVEHKKTKELLGMATTEKTISPDKIGAARDSLVQAHQMLQKTNEQEGGFGTDIANLLMHSDRFAAIEAGVDWKVLDGSHNWVEVRTIAGGFDSADPRGQAILGSLARVTPVEARNLKLETLYERIHPFSIAVLFCLIGFMVALLASKDKKFILPAQIMIFVVLAIQIFGMALRVMISGRAPVTNMYETVMWVGFGTFALSAILGWRLKDTRLLAVGFAGNAVCLMMMTFATRMLDGTIQPLVPVLRDNFWLSTHVTTITLSYACFALGWFIANFVLIRWLFGHKVPASVQKWNLVIRMAVQIGAVMLAAGIILGGVWADYSWGRFWGWDPKETWSLIALVAYMGILHGRYVGWFKDIMFTVMAAVGFLFVLMAWFGVNYILAAGLHSYGFSAGGSAFLMTIFLAQLVILGAVLGVHYGVFKQPRGGKGQPA